MKRDFSVKSKRNENFQNGLCAFSEMCLFRNLNCLLMLISFPQAPTQIKQSAAELGTSTKREATFSPRFFLIIIHFLRYTSAISLPKIPWITTSKLIEAQILTTKLIVMRHWPHAFVSAPSLFELDSCSTRTTASRYRCPGAPLIVFMADLK